MSHNYKELSSNEIMGERPPTPWLYCECFVVGSNKVLGGWGWIMSVAAALSAFGSLNGTFFSGGRVCFVAAREGHMVSTYLPPRRHFLFLRPHCLVCCHMTQFDLAYLRISDDDSGGDSRGYRPTGNDDDGGDVCG